MSDPESDSENLAFKDELLQSTLTAVRSRRHRRAGVRAACAAGVVALIGVASLQLNGTSETTTLAVQTKEVAPRVEPDPVFEITMVKSQAVPEALIVRTGSVKVENYIVRTRDTPIGIGKATDKQLFAALEGKGVILATDQHGRTDLRVLD